VAFSMAHAPWAGLGLYATAELTMDWRTHRFEFRADESDGNARIHFDLAGPRGVVELSGVALRDRSGAAVEPNLAILGYYPASRRVPGARRRVAAEHPEPHASGPRFSVVIPTYQRSASVARAVRGFAAQEFEHAFEVIVVVDGSTDGTADALGAFRTPFPLTVLERTNRGAAAARNEGAAVARGDYLLFLDDDMEPHPRLLAEHDLCLSATADAVLGHLPLHPGAPSTFLTAEYDSFAVDRAARLSQPGAELTLEDLLTGQLSVKRAIFDELGGFDTRFTQGGTYGNEDLDFGIRLMEAGHEIVFNVFALSFHRYRITPRGYLRQARQTGRADVALARKHPEAAHTVFDAHTASDSRASRRLLALTRAPGLGVPLLKGLRACALGVSALGPKSTIAQRCVHAMFELEYWRGVDEAGGMPFAVHSTTDREASGAGGAGRA
jgi:glycosyltransferase involved in cell wall biosynthesis